MQITMQITIQATKIQGRVFPGAAAAEAVAPLELHARGHAAAPGLAAHAGPRRAWVVVVSVVIELSDLLSTLPFLICAS